MAKKQRCEISFITNGAPKHVTFHTTIQDTAFCDLFMSEYNDLGLATNEKRELSMKDRERLCHFKNLDHSELQKHAMKLVKSLAKIKRGSHVEIVAKDFAAYVCLTAIYSGEMPSELTFNVRLEEVPVKLFPENLVQTKRPDNVDLDIHSDESSWLHRFQTVCEFPRHLETKPRRTRQAA